MKKFVKLLFIIAGFLTMQLSLAENAFSDINGKMVTYYDNGNKMANKEYKNGVPVGIWESWHSNGKSSAMVTFLGSTGQIKEVEARYPSGSLLFKGSAQIKESLKEKQEKYMTIKFDKGCKGIASKVGDGSQWYSNYELEFYSFYEDGTCEQAVADNMYRLVVQMYMRITDTATGNIYDFPWNNLWDTVPQHLRQKSE